MILSYKVRMAGPYHIKEGIPCQDAYYIKKLENGVAIAAVADGLGSEMYSDKGAKVASYSAVTYCAKNYRQNMTDDEVRALLRRAYTNAYAQVVKKANADQNDVEQYDCTLCMVIYDGKRLYYGQSGDSGLIVTTNDGTYMKVTEQQRDEIGCVYPLCFGPEYWEFGKVENVASAMLMTDGIWEKMICLKLLEKEEQPINVALAEQFMNHFELPETEVKALEKAAYRFVRDYDERLLDDDKTLVVLWNSDANPARKEDAYYAAPDWEMLKKKRNDSLYLYKKEKGITAAVEKVIHPIVNKVQSVLHIDLKV